MKDREPTLLYLGDGPERRAVEALAAELGVSDRVVISPTWVSDVRPFLRTAVGLVHSSRQEGLPRSIMEALSLEVPVITTAARGCPELVGDDRGEVVPVGDTARLAMAMDRFVKDPAGRAAMGTRGRALMVERYDQRLIIAEHERLYAELLPDAPLSPAEG
jgi:glycosyltransferase involved in cell wall biosynthesis